MGWTPRRRRSSALALLAVAALGGGAARAWAGERPTVAVVVLPGARGDLAVAREVRRQLIRAFVDDPGVQLSDPLAQAGVPEEVPDDSAHEQLLERGKQKLAARRYHAAVVDLEKAVATIRANLDAVPKAALAEALLHLAAARAGEGRLPAALAVLKDLLAWRPQVSLTVADPPVGWEELEAQAREWLTTAGVGALMITSVPPRAEAFVDGRRLGPTPVLAANLVAGTHFASVRMEGHQRVVVPVEVQAGKERTVSLTLRPLPEHAAVAAILERLRGTAGGPRLAEAEALRRHTEAARLLLVVAAGEAPKVEIRAYYYDLAANRLLAQATVRTGFPPRPDDLRPLALWGPTTRPERPRPGGGRPWYRRWWVWTIAGAAVVTALALPLGITQRHDAAGERFRVQW
jgi:hypothetical protein